MIDLLLKNACLPGQDALEDIAIDRRHILQRGPGLEYSARQEIDLKGCLVIPGFVEPHLHLDIALMNSAQRPGRPEPFLTPASLNERVERERKAFTRQDIERRASAALELACRHGVMAVRAQCHVDPEVGLKHLEGLVSVKERYAGRVSMQIVAFPQQGLLRPEAPDLFREAFRCGADVMGCASNLDRGGSFRQHIDAALDLAQEMDVDLDAHADMALLSYAGLNDLEVVYLARRALQTGYVGRVTAGHVCALGSVMTGVAEEAIALIKEARVNIVSQPDLYRLGRQDRQNVRRGLTRVKQLLAAGVNVALGSNNLRDVFRPLGNFNPLEEALVLSYGAHMDTVEELEALLHMCTDNAARVLGLPDYGLEPGCRADLVVLDALSPSAAVAGQVEKLFVFKGGLLLAANRVTNLQFSGVSQEQEKYDIIKN